MLHVDLKPPPQLLAQPEMLRRVLPEIAEAIRNDIVSMSQRQLGPQSAREYAMGVTVMHFPITPRMMLRGSYVHFATVALHGWLPNALEKGLPAYDMKPGLLTGRNAKVGKDGNRYNTVPFSHGTPGSVGHAGTPMGSAEKKSGMSRSQAELLGKRIHRAAQKLAATTSNPKTGTEWGQRLKAGTAGAQKLKKNHSTDVYAGMVRQEKTYGKATQSKYSTFRRVSDKSPADKWLHPGITAHHFFDQAAARAGASSRLIMQGAVRGLARGLSGTGL
tara:strand:- start:3246 stop:4070 length:825 start_codon:yes stop_codon:yes gene_type:complete